MIDDVEVALFGPPWVKGEIGIAFEPEGNNGSIGIDMVFEKQGDELVVDIVLEEGVTYGAYSLSELAIGVGFAIDEKGVTVGIGGDAVEKRGQYDLVERGHLYILVMFLKRVLYFQLRKNWVSAKRSALALLILV